MFKLQGTDIVIRVRLLFVGVLLLLNFVGLAQTQLRCVEVKGKGFVQARSDISCVENATERPCAIFTVEVGKEVSFSIKPGAQYYLAKIEIEDTSGKIKEVSRERIYAERNDTLYYQCNDTVNVKYCFIFENVKPWSGLVYPPYGSRDRKYYLIYTPEELFYACKTEMVRYFEQTISLQNDIDFGRKITSEPFENGGYMEVLGNNKIVKDLFYQGGEYMNFLTRAKRISNIHVIGGNMNPFYFEDYFNRSVEGCTSSASVSTNGPRHSGSSSSARRLQAGNCINFGDKIGPISFFVLGLPNIQKNLINWGISNGEGANPMRFKRGPACFWFFVNQNIQEQSRLLYLFNFGRENRFSNFYTPEEQSFLVNNMDLGFKESAENVSINHLPNGKLIDSAFMRNLMGDNAEEDFIFEDGFYPRLRHMDERPGRLAASPILFSLGENADSVRNPFYVDTNYGVRWISLSEDLVEIVGDSGYVRRPVSRDVTVRIEAWKGEFNKHVDLKIRARSFVDKEIGYDTVCPGDSVWMVTSYARNEGWNYDVIWGEGKDTSPDTVYRLHLHHKRGYRDTLHFEVARDSLPYIYKEDTIKRFGLTELHRYLTVEGCDSIIYVQLDTLDNRQEIHHWDTLCLCSGDTSVRYWRGFPITGVGEVYDEVIDPYKGGIDTFYHLRADIYPKYRDTYTDSCYIEELPYTVGGRVFASFGEYTENLITTAGCDSVREYSLSRRWHHYRVSVRVRGGGSVNVSDTVLREDGRLWLAFTASSCHKLDSLKIDGRSVPPQSRYELKDLHGDCEVEAVFSLSAPAESVLRYEVCGDSLPLVYNGEAYGVGEHEIRLRSAQGCDSVLRLYVQGKENTARLAVLDTIAPPCGASEIAFSYHIEAGSPKYLRLMYDSAAQSAGFRDTTLAVNSTGRQTVHIALPSTARPDRYGLQLWQADGTGCYAAEEALTFEIPYPSDIIVQKWNNVLAVLSSEYNGGYEFSGYQWYRNGELLEGETRPYIYVKPYLRSTDTYAVLLERASDGLQLQSCGIKRKSYPKELTLELRPNPTAADGEVQVSVIGKPEAEGIIEVFDGLGKPVYQKAFHRSHTLRANWQPGSYVVRVRDGKGSWTATGKLLVL